MIPFRDARHLAIATSLTAPAVTGRGPPLSQPAARNGSWSPRRGVPGNGGLVLAGAGGQSLITPAPAQPVPHLLTTAGNQRRCPDWPSERPGPRGTIHPLPTAGLPMWTGALPALPSSVPMHPEGARFTPEQADEVIAASGAALAPG